MKIVIIPDIDTPKHLINDLKDPVEVHNALIYIGEQLILERIEENEGEIAYRAIIVKPTTEQGDSIAKSK